MKNMEIFKNLILIMNLYEWDKINMNGIKLIIAGSRDIHLTPSELADIIREKIGDNWCYDVTEIVSGGAIGVDRSGEEFADEYGLMLTRFPAAWAKYGAGAGPRRNLMMAEYGDVLLLVWNGRSSGSKNMKARMLGLGKPVIEIIGNYEYEVTG